ncbi:MAG: hypothetical protein EBR82_59550 [Caulobacteraceae bacterium]|nr:hypothetical protein [Caulobacteraceae bacterium]
MLRQISKRAAKHLSLIGHKKRSDARLTLQPCRYRQVTPGAQAAATIAAGLQAPARIPAGLLQLLGINAPAEGIEATSEYQNTLKASPENRHP